MFVRVKTVKPEQESTDWSAQARRERRWSIKGVIVDRSDSHGLVYEVKHDDGSTAWYEPRELQLVG